MDVGEEQTRGTETLESLLRIWVWGGFPLGKSQVLEADGEEKVGKTSCWGGSGVCP